MAIVSFLTDTVTSYPHVLLGAGLLFVFIYCVGLFFNAPKPGPNPFERDCRRPREPLVTDQNDRDKVLKQGFTSKKVPGQLDAIVIGSGIGGLTSANILARTGKKVLVLEQHDQAGGCLHSFIDKGFEFDVGIHYIGKMHYDTSDRFIMEQLYEGQLEWVPLADPFDNVVIGEEPSKAQNIPIYGSPEGWKKALLERFPKEEAAIDKFVDIAKKISKSQIGFVMLKFFPVFITRILISTGLVHLMTNYFKFAKMSVKQVLDDITDDDDLKLVLAYSFGDFGCAPAQASIVIQTGLFHHFLHGAAYPKGGSSELAYHLIPQIERAGGKVLVRAPVSSIIVDKGKAVGVTVHKSSGDVNLYAPIIISTAGVINTFSHLLPREIATKSNIYPLLNKTIRPGVSCMQLFVGLNGTNEDLGLSKGQHNTWYFTGNNVDTLVTDYTSLSVEQAVDAEVPLLFISFPSAKDPTYQERHPGKSVCEVVTLAPWAWFSKWQDKQVNKRGDDYEQVKQAVGQRMWEKVADLFPQIADKVEYFDVATPVSQKYYLGYGEMYGLDHNIARFANMDTVSKLRPQTDIPGLYLSGQDVFCCGYGGGMAGGVLCASQILNRQLFGDLATLRKKSKKTE